MTASLPWCSAGTKGKGGERDAGNADRTGVAKADCQAVFVGLGGHLGGGQARSRPCGARDRIDVERLQIAQVDDDPARGRAVTGATVTAATHRELEAGVLRRTDHRRDIARAGDPDDDRRTAVDVAQENGACLVIIGVGGLDDFSLNRTAKCVKR